MNDKTESINRRVKDSELKNPLAEILQERHGQQIQEIDEFLHGIGYLDDTLHTGDEHEWIEGRGVIHRPSTDEECRTVKMEWDIELAVDITGDIPAQTAEGLKKIARRMMRAAKRIELAASAGEFSPEGRERRFRVIKDGEIIGTFPTSSAAVLHAMRNDGKWFEDTGDDEDDGESESAD